MNANLQEMLKVYKGVETKGIMKEGIMYIGNLNDEDHLYYWSPLSNLDVLSFITTDRYGKEVCA